GRVAPSGVSNHHGRQLRVVRDECPGQPGCRSASRNGGPDQGFVMHWFNRLRNRFRAFTNIQAVDRDLDDEVTAHLEASAAEYEASGLSREAALLAARRDFGAVTQVME